MKKIYFIVLLSALMSCNSDNFNKKKIEKDIKQTLLQWHLYSKVKIEENNNSLFIEILFPQMDIKELERPYYFDEFSNKLLIKTLLKKYSNQLFRFQKIKVNLRFPFFKDSDIDINIGKIEKKHILNYFSNEQFYDIIIFNFQEFTPQDIGFLDSQLRYITNYLKLDEIKYWKLIENLFKNKNTKDKELFQILIGNLKNNDYDLESKYLVDKLSVVLSKVNIPTVQSQPNK